MKLNLTENQVEILEDKIINLISPVHGYLDLYINTGKLTQKKATELLLRLEDTAKYLRSLRQEHLRITK